jgi:hypothetical protein
MLVDVLVYVAGRIDDVREHDDERRVVRNPFQGESDRELRAVAISRVADYAYRERLEVCCIDNKIVRALLRPGSSHPPGALFPNLVRMETPDDQIVSCAP